ncbi:fasciclin domain-containing protein [Pontibacter chinhatensis]|uniref:Uncaracterized surface protein containing fasciclin (FAS1) repeats n=1 Tax=Pontibacter chinhatensis TaxID=1436961 RepID=A0A1I2RLH0_9BACT|nr:fasciclin domain-containing protein [Pontibacter chinhatensis]SFG41515.1 Uncaracterized surface protein containing fasciclin (FAS1) repeats [Pontibacter chinhatensis]
MKYTLFLLALAGLLSCTSRGNVSFSQTQEMTGSDTTFQATDYDAMFEDVKTAQYTLAALIKMDPNLSTFAVMIEQADLTAALAEETSLTLFAPTNEAFASWPQDSVNMLMKPEYRAQLIRLLQAHMLLRQADAASLSADPSIETSGGEYAAVTVNDDTVSVGGATIVKANVRASNGILHVVDKVITPVESRLERY